jgi:DNA-binding response OmpR family regulator
MWALGSAEVAAPLFPFQCGRFNMRSVTTSTSEYAVLLYSHRPAVIEQMRSAIGEEPVEGVKIEYAVAGEYDEAVALIDKYDVDLVLLDGEAQPAGGLGIARQLRDEFDEPPLLAVVVARAADRWLAAWSRADAVLMHPLNPVTTGQTVVDLLVSRAQGVAPAQRAA